MHVCRWIKVAYYFSISMQAAGCRQLVAHLQQHHLHLYCHQTPSRRRLHQRRCRNSSQLISASSSQDQPDLLGQQIQPVAIVDAVSTGQQQQQEPQQLSTAAHWQHQPEEQQQHHAHAVSALQQQSVQQQSVQDGLLQQRQDAESVLPQQQEQQQDAGRFIPQQPSKQLEQQQSGAQRQLAAGGVQGVKQEHLQLLKRMLAFMGPALIIPLGDPLMTLTDTMFIGQCAGTRELAAMGPANIILSFSQYVFQALQVAAISLISDDLRKGLIDKAEHTFQLALTLAVSCGMVIMLLMEVAAEQLIAGTGADPTLVPLAASYMRIRALAQPAVLVTMASQGGLLAQRDSRTPALAVMLAVAVNIISNLTAVAWLGLGLQGAAATTVATQVVGAAVLLLVARRRSTLEPGLCPVDLTALKTFASTMGPLSVTYICKNLCYILLQTAAASLSMVQLAAHQAVFSVWNLLAFTTAPLEQAALTYIPASTTRAEQRTTLQLLLLVSVVIGVVCGSIACAVPLVTPQLLTKDAAVWPHMARVSPLALLAMLLTAADVAATGILLARRDLAYVARAFMFTLTALAVFVSVFVKGPYGMGLDGVWWGLVLFFGVRCVQSVGRLVVTNSSTMKDPPAGMDGSSPDPAPQGT